MVSLAFGQGFGCRVSFRQAIAASCSGPAVQALAKIEDIFVAGPNQLLRRHPRLTAIRTRAVDADRRLFVWAGAGPAIREVDFEDAVVARA